MNIAVILAGGVGTRVGAEIPKQYIKILGKPVMVYTVEKLEKNPNIDAIEIVCIKGHVPYVKDLVKEYGITKVKWYSEGGSTFQESTMNGIFDFNSIVDYSYTNANIDFSSSFDARDGMEYGRKVMYIINCNFSGVDLSNNDIMDTMIIRSNISNTNIEIFFPQRTPFAFNCFCLLRTPFFP